MDMDLNEIVIKDAAIKILNEELCDIQLYSNGAYSVVYKAKCIKCSTYIIIKIYLKNGFMLKEIRQLEELRKFSSVVPKVYGYYLGDNEHSYDMFFMELMQGIPVRYLKIDNEIDRKKVVNAVVDAHISVHSVINPNGFGELACNAFSLTWETLFHNRINGYYKYLCALQNSPISSRARNLIDKAYYSFDSVFSEPVKEARLIHGDFKMKNVLIDPKTLQLTAILDPMGCCYGDRESDLFPYTSPHKDSKFGFLENYTSKVCLSDKFLLKNQYYFLWNEIKHFILMGYCFNSTLEQIGQNISDMQKYGW